MWFHRRCDVEVDIPGQDKLPGGVSRLENYRKAFNRSTGFALDHPLKDGLCDHTADALRTFAEADAHGLIPTDSPRHPTGQGRTETASTFRFVGR